MAAVRYGNNCKVQLHSCGKSHIDVVRDIAAQLNIQNREDAFFLADLGDIVKKYEKWTQLLPRVEPFYAVKCNPDVAVVSLLAHLGTGFDCASKEEICRVLKRGVAPSRIIYAHTCKSNSYIRYAAERGVDLMTFDNEEELIKVKAAYPEARLVLRILPPSGFKVLYDMGNKFGCAPGNARKLLLKARQLGLRVVGVSFHVGCGAETAAFTAAVEAAAAVFEEARAVGFHPDLLDIGGGFPGASDIPKGPGAATDIDALISFEVLAQALKDSLDTFFPVERGVRIIAEPGTYFVASAFSLTTQVISKRRVDNFCPTGDIEAESQKGEKAFMYYLNDGVYGSFRSWFYDNSVFDVRVIKPQQINKQRFPTALWGPTAQNIDRVSIRTRLPELQVGDHLNFPAMGAYAIFWPSSFSGMPCVRRFYYCSEPVWRKLFPTQDTVTAASVSSGPLQNHGQR